MWAKRNQGRERQAALHRDGALSLMQTVGPAVVASVRRSLFNRLAAQHLVRRPVHRLSGRPPGMQSAVEEPLMDPARRRSVVDVAMQEGAIVSVEAGNARPVARSAALGDSAFRHHDPRSGRRRAVAPHRRNHFTGRRFAAGTPDFRLRISYDRTVESGHREIRCARSYLRHDHHFVHRHADRGPGRADDRILSDRTVPAMAAAADRHRNRAARRHSQHHLRHLGSLHFRSISAGHLAAVPDQVRSAMCQASPRFLPDRPTASAC